MKKSRSITGIAKAFFYLRMSLACAMKFRSLPLLLKAGRFTAVFFKHKLLRLPSGEYKLDFYMPRYPSEAFFTAIADKLLRKPPRPVSVVWSISKACAYKCPHCYQGLDSARELEIPKIRALARRLREFGVVAWAVEGGEPMLRFEKLQALLEETKGLEVWVNSTGFGADGAKIAKMAELGVTGVMGSIHSVDPQIHDSFTGSAGSFDRVFDFLKECRARGMLAGLNTVLSDEQIISGQIDSIMDLASKNGCDYVQLIHPKACGRWVGREFDNSRHALAVEIACKAQKKYNSSRARGSAILTAQVFEESREMLGCTAGGIDRFYVGCSGEVQPCEFVNISFGNLNEESFEAIFRNAIIMMILSALGFSDSLMRVGLLFQGG